VKGVAERVVRGLHSRVVQRGGRRGAAKLRAVQFSLDDAVVELVGMDAHDVDPVVQYSGRVGGVGAESVAVGPRNSLLQHEGVGTVAGGRVRRRRPGGSTAHDRDIYAFHTM
jgi:hypothetical protein